MIQIEETTGQVIASELRDAIQATNQAILAQARLCVSIMETVSTTVAPVSTSQRLIEATASGITDAAASRANVSEAVRQMVHIQRASTLETVALGCPNGIALMTAEAEPVARKDVHNA